MRNLKTDRNSYRILTNKNSSKFRVEVLTEIKPIHKLIKSIFGESSDKYFWKLLETGDRDVIYDFKTLEKAEEAINNSINFNLRKQNTLINDSEWSEVNKNESI